MAMEPSASWIPAAVRMRLGSIPSVPATIRAAPTQTAAAMAPTAREVTPTVTNFPARTRPRDGVMVRVDWIIPVEYSEPTWIAARMTMMNAAASTPRIPASRISSGSRSLTARPWVTGRLT